MGRSRVSIAELMERSGVQFGTSGARGRVSDMTDRVCYAYTAAFLQYLQEIGELAPITRVAVGGDLRPSTGRILAAVARAAHDGGYRVVPCGRLPSPALALYGIRQGIPAVMVTGSHIPDDRNGIKFSRATGEILKDDEAGIRRQTVTLPAALFDGGGAFLHAASEVGPPLPDASEVYVRRYLDAFPGRPLDGLRLGLYEHSSVGRDPLHRILTGLGAEVERLGRSDAFVPVDTEAIRTEDADAARSWAAGGRFDAIVSSDGDGDRPLLSDESGGWLRGDVAGILTARFLGAQVVVVPVSCNTAAERCGAFREVRRTRIGSPYVIGAMLEALADGAEAVVGYEANGGFLTASPLRIGQARLDPLPTRDAAIVLLGVLLSARREGVTISRLLAGLPRRFTASERLQAFPTELSQALLAELNQGNIEERKRRFSEAFGGRFGAVRALDTRDGLRGIFESGEIVHLRPSGNAPEFRCYTEADREERAMALCREALGIMAGWLATPAAAE